GMALGVGGDGGLVHEVGVLGDMEGDFGGGGGDGEGHGFARGAGPGFSAVGAFDVADVVVGGDVGGASPGPGEMQGTVAADAEFGIGVLAAFAGDEIGLDGGPGLGGG